MKETATLAQAMASADATAPASAVTAWAQMIERHLFHGRRRMRHELPLRIQLPEPHSFDGRIRAGLLGDLPYSHLAFGAHTLICENPPPLETPHHMVVLQLAGTSSFRVEEHSVRLRPGEMLFFREPHRMQIEHDTRTEQIALLNPLPIDLAQRLCSTAGMVHRTGQGREQRTLQRWLGDACVDGCWDDSGAGDDVAQMLSRLLGRVLCGSEPAAAPRPAASSINRESIEAFIARHLEDPELTLARIADAYSCSVRTLHRAFAREGSESLERYLWQQRVFACARALRDPSAAATTLTDLALRYGFKSPTHFSVLFRDIFGVTPSAYRREQRG
jgi:AraC family transcriptional activator of tynA and feaB